MKPEQEEDLRIINLSSNCDDLSTVGRRRSSHDRRIPPDATRVRSLLCRFVDA